MSAVRSDAGVGLRLHAPAPHPSSGLRGPELTAACLRTASDLGFVRAGVASLDPFPAGRRRLEAFVRQGFHGSMEYLEPSPEGPERHTPRALFPEGKSLISVALPYPSPSLVPLRASASGAPIGAVANYARGTDYHIVLKQRLLALGDSLASLAGVPVTSRACVDTAPLLERDLAVRAGYAFFGKNTLCIAPGAGSHFLLGELIVDVELPGDTPAQPDGCGTCRACLDACPTNAFVGPYQLDARRCVSYLTIEHTGDIPRPLREGIGTRVFGCDECQAVCPYNKSAKPRPSEPEFQPRKAWDAPSLIDLLGLTSSGYKKLVRRTALRRANRDQLARNAVVALGNSGDAAAVVPLEGAARAHRSPIVRRHATWALGRLATAFGHSGAVGALERLRSEGDPEIAEEAHLALTALAGT